ncbi:MAG: glycosyltransferase [Candidatus Accumulibacter sp.]|jgi:glycosyltransferase involved in cell wall biosynthesis|nr:glycosyltransferase [Accumulibacter sp.]
MSKSQGKVSMIVPCYNKEKYIGAMLDSVLAQEWNNIELLLVNDGSTDGTRDVIVNYLPKFEKRGYKVKLIDQENGGCCKAVHTGLVNMTGDYFCLVDADDELNTEYVSKMAAWLDEHADFEWACCSYQVCVKNDDGTFAMQPMTSCSNMNDNVQLLERHIIRQEITTSWIYMTRKSYIDKTKLIETFCTERKKTYEPLFAVPLMLGGGKLKTIDEPLYKFNRHGSDLYYFDTCEKVVNYYSDYSYLYRHCIDRADIPDKEKRKIHKLIDYGYRKDVLYHLNKMDKMASPIKDAEIYLKPFAESFSKFIDVMITPAPSIPSELLANSDYFDYINEVDKIVLNNVSNATVTTKPRLIGYGALGKIAKRLLPVFGNRNIKFDYLWDANADESIDSSVTLPEFNLVADRDIIVVFPKSSAILVEVARKTGNAYIVYAPERGDIIKHTETAQMFHNGTFVIDG